MTEMSRATRAALAVISGLALAAAFPKVDLSLLAWIALVPLLYAIEGESPRRVFFYAWIQGFACYVASVYWIAITLHSFTSLPVYQAIAPMLLLAAVLALFTAVSFAVAVFITARLQLRSCSHCRWSGPRSSGFIPIFRSGFRGICWVTRRIAISS